MTTLTDVHCFLAAGLRDDPLLCLAQAVACFDPFWQGIADDEIIYDDPLAAALDITRGSFPGVYALAVDALHHGATYDDLDRLICAEISALGIPLDCIETMNFGIPLPAYGAELHKPDFYAYHPDVLPVVQLFGVQPEDDRQVDVPERIYSAARIIAHDLAEHADERYRQVSWLIQWIFGISQNTSVDWPPAVLFEVEPLSWEPDDIAFAIELIREADTIMEDAAAGLQWLLTQPAIMQALHDNIQRLYRSLARQTRKERKNHDYSRLHWPAPDSGLAGTTEPHP